MIKNTTNNRSNKISISKPPTIIVIVRTTLTRVTISTANATATMSTGQQ